MAYILNIETSTTNCSVSLSNEGETLVLKEDYNTNYSHAESLHVFIDEVIKEANLKLSQINAISVSKGPGSYTGLRIGVSAAKGLCFSLNVPLISVDTLESLAHQLQVESGFIIPLLDARRMEVYASVYDNKYQNIRATEAEIITETSFSDYLETSKVYFIGDGVEKIKTVINHPNANFIDGKMPSSKNMCILSFDKYKKSDFEDVAYFEPFYLKDFIGLKS